MWMRPQPPNPGLFSVPSAPFSQTWPASGSMRNGRSFERPKSAPRISAHGSSFSPGGALLPTPRTSDSQGPGKHGDGGMDLRTTVSLLPTPRASDTGTPGRRASEGFRPPLSQVVLPLNSPLLPTPMAGDSKGTRNATANRSKRNPKVNPGWTLTDVVYGGALLPTPVASDGERSSATYSGGNPTLAGALLPTPTTRDWKVPGDDRGRREGLPLNEVVDRLAGPEKLLPTPTATPYGSNQSASPGAAVRPSLETLAPKLLPTPRASDGEKGGPNQRGSKGDLTLPSAAALIGGTSSPRSAAGSTSPDGPHPQQLTIEDV